MPEIKLFGKTIPLQVDQQQEDVCCADSKYESSSGTPVAPHQSEEHGYTTTTAAASLHGKDSPRTEGEEQEGSHRRIFTQTSFEAELVLMNYRTPGSISVVDHYCPL
ncbi:hypothetical protein OIU85_023947 [Salix viminalis]|uniref:Uncharacterized protein n=1 Tax=Salix viminalis TaxID=40686 RepID=A0A9Q0TZR8_SALVM|nr:hypothetical protein OIU85_023947 [Salix viminalis]